MLDIVQILVEAGVLEPVAVCHTHTDATPKESELGPLDPCKEVNEMS